MIEFPEPLWEANLYSKKLCLVCAKKHAVTVLRGDEIEIVPLCKDCSIDWNFYSYEILKRIKPWPLIRGILWFKLKYLFRRPSLMEIWRDVQRLQAWGRKMKKWLKSA